MSFFMDDVGLTPISNQSQSNIFQARTVEKSNNPSTTEDAINQVEDIDVENLKSKVDQNTIEDVQKAVSVMELAKNGIVEVSDNLTAIKKDLEKALKEDASKDHDWDTVNKNINEKLSNVDKVVKNTKFDDNAILKDGIEEHIVIKDFNNKDIDISKNIKEMSLKNIELKKEDEDVNLKSKEDAESFISKVNGTIEKIRDKEDAAESVSQDVNNLADNALSMKDFLLGKPSEDYSDSGIDLKDAALKSLLENPAESIDIQIKSLDEDIIVALLNR